MAVTIHYREFRETLALPLRIYLEGRIELFKKAITEELFPGDAEDKALEAFLTFVKGSAIVSKVLKGDFTKEDMEFSIAYLKAVLKMDFESGYLYGTTDSILKSILTGKFDSDFITELDDKLGFDHERSINVTMQLVLFKRKKEAEQAAQTAESIEVTNN